ncbi:MAG: TonB-dependent receptor, partial [Bacteroidota bacterium]|nr:TonB-dependent receptor [Bacteroidota bacterium]
NADTTQSKDFRDNHNIGLRLEQNIDSADILIAKANINFNTTRSDNALLSLYSDANDITTRDLTTLNNNKLAGWNINSAAIFRHRLKKKGANFAISGGYNSTKSDGLDNPFSFNRFFEANTFTDQVRELTTNNHNTTNQFKSSMLWTEPLSKVFFLEAFYNFNETNNVQDKLTQNAALQNIRVDSLTAYYTNEILFNRVGTTFRYSNNGLNASLGLAVQQLQLKGNYSLRNDMPDLKDPINKNWSNLVPNVSIRYQLTKAIYLSSTYSLDINQPTMNQLMPIVNVNNPAFIIQGNPNLQPSHVNNFYFFTYYSNQASMTSCYLSFNYMNTVNAISNIQNITMVNNIGMQTITRPENMKGFDNWFSIGPQINFPLIKTKLTMSAYGQIGFGITPTIINDIDNVVKNKRTSFRVNFNLTPSPKLTLSTSGNISFNYVRYSLRNDLNQDVKNYGSNSSLKWQFATKSYLESSFNYSVYKNASFGFNRNIPLLSASLRQIVGKANQIELRLAAYDILNKNQSISQTASENYVISTSANTLARYFLLSFSYNIKGFDLKSSNRNMYY